MIKSMYYIKSSHCAHQYAIHIWNGTINVGQIIYEIIIQIIIIQ